MTDPRAETIHPNHDALLVIDLQPDFMPGGALAVPGGDEIVTPIAAIIPRFRTVIATQDWHPAGHISFGSTHGKAPFSPLLLYGGTQTLWPDHCVQDTPGAALHRDLPQKPLNLILRKGADPRIDSYSAFRENTGPDGQRRTTGLAALLKARGIRRVFVCGLARDFCVLWTAADAVTEGLEAIVIDDLCRAVLPHDAATTDAALADAGVRRTTTKALGQIDHTMRIP